MIILLKVSLVIILLLLLLQWANCARSCYHSLHLQIDECLAIAIAIKHWTIKFECNSFILLILFSSVSHPIRWVFCKMIWLLLWKMSCFEHTVATVATHFDWERVKVLHFKLVLNVKSTKFNSLHILWIAVPLYGCSIPGCNTLNRVLIICQTSIKFVTY